MHEYLKLENISKRYDDKIAVDNLSLSVPKGSIYGVIGPNGAGKTTTIRMIMDIIAPDAGKVLINGQNAVADFKNKVGYLPEERGLYKKMTLEEIISLLAEIKGCSRNFINERIPIWLDKMSLGEYRKKKVEELSKGMQQKLQFITTLLHEPDLIILDELFSGLDPLNIELIKNILLEEKRRGTTILFSTHVMEQAEKLCDYICLINKGKKVLDGRLAEIKSRFGRNTVHVEAEGDTSFVRSLPGVEKVTEFNNYLELKLNETADSRAILKEIADRLMVRRFEMLTPSLYSIFIDIARVDPDELTRKEPAL